MRIAIVTARAAVGTDVDEPLLLAALWAAGADAERNGVGRPRRRLECV
jgi:hypothetical protein